MNEANWTTLAAIALTAAALVIPWLAMRSQLRHRNAARGAMHHTYPPADGDLRGSRVQALKAILELNAYTTQEERRRLHAGVHPDGGWPRGPRPQPNHCPGKLGK